MGTSTLNFVDFCLAYATINVIILRFIKLYLVAVCRWICTVYLARKNGDNQGQQLSYSIKDCTAMSETGNSQDRGIIPESLTLKHSIGGHSGEIYQLHWSPTGRFLASVTSDNSIEIWDAENWQTYKALPKVSLLAINITWSPDEKTLALVSANGILLWSLETNAVLQWPGLEGNTAFTCVA